VITTFTKTATAGLLAFKKANSSLDYLSPDEDCLAMEYERVVICTAATTDVVLLDKIVQKELKQLTMP
jgi:hypothetical protein